MKSLKKLALIAVMIVGCRSTLVAQQNKSLEVVTQLQELKGNYDERKLYRGFLTEAMKRCPYISHFHIIEAPGTEDNHRVEWIYEVSGWNDVTKFYSWMNTAIHESSDSTLIKALTPYKPNYSLGGVIEIRKREKNLVKH